MELIGRLLYGGPGGPTRHGGAVRHIGLCRRDVSADWRRQSEVIQKLPQNSGYRPNKPMSVQDGLQVFPLWRTSLPAFVDKPASWAGTGAPNFGATPDSRIARREFVSVQAGPPLLPFGLTIADRGGLSLRAQR